MIKCDIIKRNVMMKKIKLYNVSKYIICEFIKGQSCHHIETNQLICCANQLTGVYMMATLVFNGLITISNFIVPG